MRRAGVAATAAQGVIVVEADDDPPSIGETVVDESLDRVGRIVDVIGPTANPYLVVTTVADVSPAALLGKPLYLR